MLANDPVKVVHKVDFEDIIDIGEELGYTRDNIITALDDCELGIEYDVPVFVAYPEYIDRIGIFASCKNRVVVQNIINSIFTRKPDLSRLFILDR